jgi:hypothetical protein
MWTVFATILIFLVVMVKKKTKMTKNKAIIIFGAALLLVISSLYFFVIKNPVGSILRKPIYPFGDSTKWRVYTDNLYKFKIKIPSDWEEYVDNNAYSNRWLSGKSSTTKYALNIRVNNYSELTPYFPDYSSFDFLSSTAEVSLFKGKMKRSVFIFSNREGVSVFGDFCLNKEGDIKNPEPDFDASEATMRCLDGYDFYNFNLLCAPGGDDCSDIFDTIVTSFEFVK